VHVRRLEEANKEEEELVDVAPHWGEPRISVLLCFVLCVHDGYVYIFLVHCSGCMIGRSIDA
jgi:hypothetical protein